MSKIILRDYQNKGVQDARNFFKKGGKKTIVQAPTGAGKTIIFSYLTKEVTGNKKKVLILTNRTELLTQAGNSLSKFGIKSHYINAGVKFINTESDVFIAMAQTLRNRIKIEFWKNFILKKIDIVIIDEAHLQDFNYLFESGLLDKKFVMGFTATPKRTGKMRQLALDYEEIVYTTSVKELVDREYLVPDDYHGVDGVDLNNIKIDKMKGDYSENDMFEKFNSPKLYSGVVKNWKDICFGTKTLVFCVNIEHCIHTVEEFIKNGIKAKFLTSNMGKPKEPEADSTDGKWVAYEEKIRLHNLYTKAFGEWSGTRSQVLKEFKRGDFTVLVNAGILTTGFDEPSIETVIVNRATTSQTLWLQMIGRGSRIYPNKTHFNILDFGGNASRLGHYLQPKAWSLWHEASKSEGGGVPPVKECGEHGGADKNGRLGCKRLIMASLKICPFCGRMTPEKKQKEAELQSVFYSSEKHQAISMKKISQMNMTELGEYCKMKGHKQAWLWRQLYFKFGTKGVRTYGNANGWSQGTIIKAENFVKNL